MSVCFYFNAALMVGLDVHAPYPMVTYTDRYAWWPGTWHKDTDTVSTAGCDFIQDGYDLFLVVHLPPPEPKAAAKALVATLTSGSKPFLSKQTVSGEGSPLACCVDGFVGYNDNCWDLGPISAVPSGVVLSPTSVMTTPTAGDFAAALAGLVMDNLTSLLMGSALKRIGLGELGVAVVMQAIRHATWLSKLLQDLLKSADLPSVPSPLPILPPLPTPEGDVDGAMRKAIQEAVDEYLAEEGD